VVTIVGPTAASTMLNAEQVTIYPNPANDFINLNVLSKAEGNVMITIVDVTGKVCLQQQRIIKTGYNKLLLNTSELNKGIYFVQTTNQLGEIKTSKLSIK
jgi:hypothetical protein